MPWYSTGTVSVTQGSSDVTANGTQFVTNVKSGDLFAVFDDGAIYEIDQVVSATEITLKRAYAGTTNTAANYDIVPSATFLKSLAGQVADLITLYTDIPQEVTDSQNAAAASATAAANSATASSTSATASAASATQSQSHATDSQNSATASAGSLNAVQAILHTLNALYLGKLSSDPTVDANGNPLTVGATYWNTTTNVMRVYGTSGWTDQDAEAENMAANASASAASAAGSATAAQTSATAAQTQASNAATQASNALTQAQNAAASATAAANSATSAASAGTTAANNVVATKVSKTGDTMTGPLLIEYGGGAASRGLDVKTGSGTLGRESQVGLWGTFGGTTNTDMGERLIAMVGAGFNGGAWGTEFVDFNINGTSPTDASTANAAQSSANMHSMIRLTRSSVLVAGGNPAATADERLQVGGSIGASGSLHIATNQPNGGIELGSTSTAGTPYFDFHTSGAARDYDVRLIASGGDTANDGKGQLQTITTYQTWKAGSSGQVMAALKADVGRFMLGGVTDDGTTGLQVVGTGQFSGYAGGSWNPLNNITANGAGMILGRDTDGGNVIWKAPTAAADQKGYDMLSASDGSLKMRAFNDAWTQWNVFFHVTRSGDAPVFMQLMETGGRVVVGGGTDDGTTTLQVKGTASIAGNLTTNGQILAMAGTAGAPGYSFQGDGAPDTGFFHISDGTFAITNNNKETARFIAGGTNRMLMNGTTDDGTSPLQVTGQLKTYNGGLWAEGTSTGTLGGASLILNNTTATTGRKYSAYSGAGGKFTIGDETAGAARMTIDSGGVTQFNNSVNLSAGTLGFADGSVQGVAVAGRNRFINGGFNVWARGSSIAVPAGADTFTADRWYAYSAGVAGTADPTWVNAGSFNTSLHLAASGNTGVAFGQRIESANIADLAGAKVTVSATTICAGGEVDVWVAIPGATDNFSTVTWTQVGSWTQPASTWSRGSCSFTMPTGATAGACIEFRYQAGDADYGIANAQIERGGAATPFEWEPVSVTQAKCKRYFNVVNWAQPSGMLFTSNGDTRATLPIPTMRAVPTVSPGSWTGNVIATGPTEGLANVATPFTMQAGVDFLKLNSTASNGLSGCGGVVAFGETSTQTFSLNAEL